MHVTTLTPLLICNCPQLVRNTTLRFRGEERLRILKLHSCLHSWSPCVCYSTRSRFQEFCFRCNNLILVGRPGRWKQQTAQNGLSLLVSLAKGLCPSRLHLQRTANRVNVRGPPGATCTCTDTRRVSLPLTSVLNKKTHVTHLIFESEFPVNPPPPSPFTASYKLARRSPAAPASHVKKADGNEIIVIPCCNHAKDNLGLDEIKKKVRPSGCNCVSVKIHTMSPRRLMNWSRW